MDATARLQLSNWLFICAAMVFATLIVGGVTRLTDSGLSIVEWQPLMGIVPPLSTEAWQVVFAKYQLTPQFLQVNHAMTLDEFKGIFWWEYAHRALGRVIGLVFLLPYIVFLLRRKVGRSITYKLFGIFILGGLQGAMGWYMVKSGLVDDPRVSQYRLTAHLSLAFVIFAAMMWVAMGLRAERGKYFSNEALRSVQRFGVLLLILASYMVVTGGFVAGIRAGKAYNTFPLMNGHIIPPEIFMMDPWYLNFFNNMATVQFDHRLGAWLLALLVPLFWFRIHESPASRSARLAVNVLVFTVAAQIALGITTLLFAVPVALGVAHQGGSMVLFGVMLWVNHELRVSKGYNAS